MSVFLSLILAFSPVFATPSLTALPEVTEAPPQVIHAPSGGWWVEDGPYLRVFSEHRDRITANRLATAGNHQLADLSQRLGLPIGGLVDVYLAPTAESFATIQPGHPPDWADGTAWPKQGLVFLRSPSFRSGTAEPLEQVLSHELVHILVGRAFGDRHPPHWLQEGLALHVAQEMTPERIRQIMDHLPGQLLDFKDLVAGFPNDPMTVQLAYAQSGDFVGFIARLHGEAALGKIVQAVAGGATLPEAMRQVTGQSPVEMEKSWRDHWDDPLLRVPIVGESLMLMGASLAAFYAIFKVRLRNQKKIERWEKEEEMALLKMAQRQQYLEQERAWRERQMRQYRVF